MHSQSIFFQSKPEKNAIYVSPNTLPNYGYMLPISEKKLSGNTYTFIYEKKYNCELFIAPVSRRRHFSKTFVSYEKYIRKHNKYMNRRHSEKNIRSTRSMRNISCNDPMPILVKTKSSPNLGVLNKLMEIFDISSSNEKLPIPEHAFKPPEPLDSYFIGSFSDDINYMDDFMLDDDTIYV
jgi:hypothetical protein